MFIREEFTERDLIAICNILCLDYSGSKEDLTKRICDGLIDLSTLRQSDNDSDGDDDDSDENETEEKNDSVTNSKSHASCQELPSRQQEATTTRRQDFPLTYQDIENSTRNFDGSNIYPVERRITDFEETAALFEWNEMQKLIFAKRSLTGLAKLFIQSEGVVKNWVTLKEKLRDEFATRIDSALLHEMLSERRMKKGEKLQEYYLVMKEEMAARGVIEDEALIRYVIRGIADDERNKAILNGTRNLRDFKERLRAYEETWEATQTQTSRSIRGTQMLRRGPSNRTQILRMRCGYRR